MKYETLVGFKPQPETLGLGIIIFANAVEKAEAGVFNALYNLL